MVGILVFQGGDWDDVYAVGALVGGVMRDFKFSTREISAFQPVRFRVFITRILNIQPERFQLFNPRDFVFAIKADFYIRMLQYGRLHSGRVGDDRKIPPWVIVIHGGGFVLISAHYVCIFTGLLFQYKYNYCNSSAHQQQCTYRYSYYQHKRSFIFNE